MEEYGDMDIEDVMVKIEDWINNDDMKRLTVVREQYDPIKFPFLLSIKPRNPKTAEIPLRIFKPTQYRDKISMYSWYKFWKDQQHSWTITDSGFKEQVMAEISQGLFAASLTSRFYPNRDNLQQIIFQDMIYSDGLSKDRIMSSVTRVLGGYGYVVASLVKHNILREPFDPSDYI